MFSQNADFGLTIPEARRLQEEYAGLVVTDIPFDFAGLRRVTGTDISYIREDRLAIAVAVSFSWPGLELLEERIHVDRVDFPYVPGLLSFRELPALLPAVRLLSSPPQLVLADGQGVAHPRSFGIASHLGVTLDLPSVGCAKSRLVGTYEEPGLKRGDRSSLTYEGREVGVVLRTRDGGSPSLSASATASTWMAASKRCCHAGGATVCPSPSVTPTPLPPASRPPIAREACPPSWRNPFWRSLFLTSEKRGAIIINTCNKSMEWKMNVYPISIRSNSWWWRTRRGGICPPCIR